MIPGKFSLKRRRLLIAVPRVTQNKRIWCATDVTRRGILDMIVGLAKRNNKKLIPLNWLKGMKISVTFYL